MEHFNSYSLLSPFQLGDLERHDGDATSANLRPEVKGAWSGLMPKSLNEQNGVLVFD